jgi:hypothetical protein
MVVSSQMTDFFLKSDYFLLQFKQQRFEFRSRGLGHRRALYATYGKSPRNSVASAMRSTPTASAVSRIVTLSCLWRVQM